MSLQEFVPTPRFEEYSQAFADFYRMERREDGVLLVRGHTQGGPVQLSVHRIRHAAVGCIDQLQHFPRRELVDSGRARMAGFRE